MLLAYTIGIGRCAAPAHARLLPTIRGGNTGSPADLQSSRTARTCWRPCLRSAWPRSLQIRRMFGEEIISLSIYERRRCRKGSRHDNDATSNAVATDRQTDRVSLSRAFCCGNLALQHKHVGSSAGMSTHMTEAAREDNLGVAEAKRVFTPMWSAWPEVSSLQIVAAEQQLLESFGHLSSGAKTRATWGRDRGKSSATVTPKNEK